MMYAIKNIFKNFIIILAIFVIASPLASICKNSVKEDGAYDVQALNNKAKFFGILGGYRSIVADFIWIKGYIYWEKRKLSECLSNLELATDIDPYSIDFWEMGAGIIAYDTPRWIMQDYKEISKPEELSIRKKQADIAINYIDKGLKIYPNNEVLLTKKGQIAIAGNDYGLAEKCYGSLSEIQGGSDVSTQRIYAAVLAKQGKSSKAIKVLEGLMQANKENPMLEELLKDQIKQIELILKKQKS